jgi:hypothetical protein
LREERDKVMQLILDIGSGNSLPDNETVCKLIDEIAKRDTHKHEVILKAQLFKSAPPNKPLKYDVFLAAWSYASDLGYHLTSSVFDIESLKFLLEWDFPGWRLPFIKIACRPDKYWLIGEVPRRIPVYYSLDARLDIPDIPDLPYEDNTVEMMCVPKYPALYVEYHSAKAISDHTVGWDLLRDYKPDILEKHICLSRSSDNPDAGPFAVVPADLEEIL